MAVDLAGLLASQASPQTKLIHEMMQSFFQKDLTALEKYFHKDFRHVFHPKSLGKPPIGREEWLAAMAKSLSTPIMFGQPTFHSVLEASGKIVFHVSANVKTLSGQDELDESICITTFAPDEDGNLKLKEVEQFTSIDHVDIFQGAKASQ